MRLFNQFINFFKQLNAPLQQLKTGVQIAICILFLVGCASSPAPTTPVATDTPAPATALPATTNTTVPTPTNTSAPTITQITEINHHQLDRGLVNRVAFSPQSGLLAVVFRDRLNKPDKGIGLYTIDPFTETDFIETTKPEEQISQIALSPNGTLLAVALPSKIQLWPVQNGQFITNAPAHNLGDNVGAETLAFSPTGDLLASVHWPGVIRLWQTTDGTLARTIGTITNTVWVKSLQFSPDGTTLAAGDVNGAISLYNVANGTLLNSFGGAEQLTDHTWGVTRLAFSPDGTRLAATSPENYETYIWRVSDGELLHSLREDTNFVNNYIFSPDGHILITLRANIHLWDVAKGTLLHRQEIPGTYLAGGGLVLPDTLLTVSVKGLAQLWALSSISVRPAAAAPTPTPTASPSPSPTSEATPTSNTFKASGLATEEVINFLYWLKWAVATDNAEAVAAKVHYPIAAHVNDKLTRIETAEQFVENYHQIMDDTVTQAVTEQKVADLFANWSGVMIGRGEVWFGGFCTDEDDDGEFTNCRTLISVINNGNPANPQPTSTPPPVSDTAELVGEWVVSLYQPGGIYAMEIDEAESWLGEVATITPNSINFRDDVCNDATFESSIVNAAEHFYEGYRTGAFAIGVEQPYVELIKTGCTGTPFSAFEKLNENSIVLQKEGVFFFLEKVE